VCKGTCIENQAVCNRTCRKQDKHMLGVVNRAGSCWFAVAADLRPANHMGYTTSRFVLSICRL
jgi:hypothetical protein